MRNECSSFLLRGAEAIVVLTEVIEKGIFEPVVLSALVLGHFVCILVIDLGISGILHSVLVSQHHMSMVPMIPYCGESYMCCIENQ